MRHIFLLGIALIIAYLSVGQQDNKARQILDEVSQKTTEYKVIRAHFIFTMENEAMDIHEKNEGSIALKGQKYVVELPDVGMKVYSDGQTLWNYMEDGNQVTISNVEDNSSELMDPSSIFSIYEKGFDSKYTGENTKGNKTYHTVELYPDTDEHQVSKIILSIDKSTMMLNSAILHGTDDNLYGVEVHKMETDIDLADSFFVFNTSDYEDIEVIDFR